MNETLQTIIPCLVVWIGIGIFTYFIVKNFDYPEKPLKYKHIRRISD